MYNYRCQYIIINWHCKNSYGIDSRTLQKRQTNRLGYENFQKRETDMIAELVKRL